MKIVEIEQGTDEWLDWRRERFMASEAAIIMGAAPEWMQDHTWTHLRELKLGFLTMFSDFQQRMLDKGHDKEEIVRARWNDAVAPEHQIAPCCIEVDDGVEAASLDGLSADRKSWHEIKTTVHGRRSSIYKETKSTGWPPEYVRWQMCHQALVMIDGLTEAEVADLTCHLWVYVDETECLHEEYKVGDIFDNAPPDMLKGEWTRFANDEPQNPLIETQAWIDAQKQWKTARNILDDAETSAEEAKDTLVKLALGDNQLYVRGDGLILQRIDKKGAVDWKNAFADLLAVALEMGPTWMQDPAKSHDDLLASAEEIKTTRLKAGSRYWQCKRSET